MKDVQVDNSGSIVGLTPITPAAREWIDDQLARLAYDREQALHEADGLGAWVVVVGDSLGR